MAPCSPPLPRPDDDFPGRAGGLRCDDGALGGHVNGGRRTDFALPLTDVQTLTRSDFIP